ncbi:ABC transporter substrate-binding protein [Longimycelium tulufanense]|uniref:ABC transporter substrate-binding protein n=1 Tax=Longimycelium tulufanense TaxID=907463 RepID=A0A8J3C9L1_9PSEU|nr:MlaD family protein [Longimycelium tulufanense]GGM60833.1 ABC transporter substrate-binding protein [Longimycelium tulufanense]
MLTRKIKIQVIVFVVIALLGMTYVGASYAGLDRLVGGSGIVVKAEMPEAGGLFTNSEVTYRGVRVGRVGPMRLTDTGIEADLYLDHSAPDIPVHLDAVVTNRSAVGEQYLDLRPRRDDGPYLTDGSVIPRSAIDLPPPVEDVLTNLDKLVASVPQDSLRTVIHELDESFRGRGTDLQTLLDTQAAFTAKATEYLPQTKNLITDAGVVLLSQSNQSSAIRSFSTDARLLADQLKRSDSDLRRLFAATPPVSEQVSALLRESGQGIGLLLANLRTPAQVFETRLGAAEHLLSAYPRAISAGYRVIGSDGTGNFVMVLNFSNPPPCRSGYESTENRDGKNVETVPLNTLVRCALPRGHETSVRGSQNAPKGGPVPNPVLPGVLALTAPESDPPSLHQLLGLKGGDR